MKTAEQSQDPLLIEDKPLLSHLYLSMAVYPHLTKAETNLLEAIWHRTSRFGYIGHTVTTFRLIEEGSGGTSFVNQHGEEDHVVWNPARFPVYPELTERHFKRIKSRLLQLGLIDQLEPKSSYFRISCYPLDYINKDKTLMEALVGDATTVGYGILNDMNKVILSLRKFKKL